MAKFRDWTGVRQGSLIIIRRVGARQDGQVLWETKCDCGSTTVKSSGSLGNGTKTCSTACGVARSNRQRARHGFARTKEYRAWMGAKQRCTNPRNPQYRHYGGRGISMHRPWVEDFALFLKDVGPAPGNGRQVSIDRIDNERGYEPGNVRWVTSMREQALNTRRTVKLKADALAGLAAQSGVPLTTVSSRWRKGVREKAELLAPPKRATHYTLDGVTKTLPEWAETVGVSYNTLRTRLNLGTPLEQALSAERQKTQPYKYKPRPAKETPPPKTRVKKFTLNGETLTPNKWAQRYGIVPSTLSYRLRKGWTIEEALDLKPKQTTTG